MNTDILTPSSKRQAMAPGIINNINESGVIAVITIDDLSQAVPVARALLIGGVNMIELTLRTPVALEAANLIKKEVPEMVLGFGTVINIDQVKAIVDAGADFAVAPVCNPKIIAEAYKHDLPFAPVVMTPTEIELSIEKG